MQDIVLASGSPRRRELLEMLGLHDFRIIPAAGGEADCTGLSPSDAVISLSCQKAREVADMLREPETLIIAADTIVWQDGVILGKPEDGARAEEMLKTLSGRGHEVYTGVTVISGDRELSRAEMTRVFFRPMTSGEIEAYVKTGEPMDKAGAYGAQGIGGLFIERLEGDFFNVMGLPICSLNRMLGELGTSLI